MFTYNRILINWFGYHGVRHLASRHVSLKRFLECK